MKAVILAAGSGHRLRALTPDKPKCLLEIGGRSLLSRNLSHLEAAGIRKVVIVVGFARWQIYRAMAADSYSGEIRWVVNDRFSRGNVLSLWAAREEMDEDLILMDADVLYCAEVLRRLTRSPCPTAVLMDETVVHDTEECMVTGRDGRVGTLGKTMPLHAAEAGETVSFVKVRAEDVPFLLDSVRVRVEAGELDLEYEDAMQDFIRNVPVGYEKIGGLPWIEIDFPEDVIRATQTILPLIEALDMPPTLDRRDLPPVETDEHFSRTV